MKKDGPVNFGALEEICDAAILYIVSTVYTDFSLLRHRVFVIAHPLLYLVQPLRPVTPP